MLPPVGLTVQYHIAQGPPGTTPVLNAHAAVIVESSTLSGCKLLLLATGRVVEEVPFSATPTAGRWSLVPDFKAKDWDGDAYNSAAAQRKAEKDAAKAAADAAFQAATNGDKKAKVVK